MPCGCLARSLILGWLSSEQDPFIQVSEHTSDTAKVSLSQNKSLRVPLMLSHAWHGRQLEQTHGQPLLGRWWLTLKQSQMSTVISHSLRNCSQLSCNCKVFESIHWLQTESLIWLNIHSIWILGILILWSDLHYSSATIHRQSLL